MESYRYRCGDWQHRPARREFQQADVENRHHLSQNHRLTPGVAESYTPVAEPISLGASGSALCIRAQARTQRSRNATPPVDSRRRKTPLAITVEQPHAALWKNTPGLLRINDLRPGVAESPGPVAQTSQIGHPAHWSRAATARPLASMLPAMSSAVQSPWRSWPEPAVTRTFYLFISTPFNSLRRNRHSAGAFARCLGEHHGNRRDPRFWRGSYCD